MGLSDGRLKFVTQRSDLGTRVGQLGVELQDAFDAFKIQTRVRELLDTTESSEIHIGVAPRSTGRTRGIE
jgi:hypothetical protein